MRSVVVTGGAGFIGSEFIRQICTIQSVEKIVMIDKLTYAGNLNRIDTELKSGKIHFINCDINNTKSYIDFLKGADVLVNFAAESHVDRSITNGNPFIDTNVVGTYKLLDAAKINLNLKILQVSTDEVYGSVVYGESHEHHKLEPSSTYAASKASADLIALSQRHTFGQRITITRSCNNYGPMQDKEKVIPTFILNAKQRKKMPVYGNGENIREWIHVSDHVSALIAIIYSKNQNPIINIGTGYRINNLELANIISNVIGAESNYFEFVPDRVGHDFRYAVSSNKLLSLGWKPGIEFKSGIKSTIDWYLKHFQDFSGE
jgi:dTDP-glucose 4,6-dehydratase